LGFHLQYRFMGLVKEKRARIMEKMDMLSLEI